MLETWAPPNVFAPDGATPDSLGRILLFSPLTQTGAYCDESTHVPEF